MPKKIAAAKKQTKGDGAKETAKASLLKCKKKQPHNRIVEGVTRDGLYTDYNNNDKIDFEAQIPFWCAICTCFKMGPHKDLEIQSGENQIKHRKCCHFICDNEVECACPFQKALVDHGEMLEHPQEYPLLPKVQLLTKAQQKEIEQLQKTQSSISLADDKNNNNNNAQSDPINTVTCSLLLSTTMTNDPGGNKKEKENNIPTAALSSSSSSMSHHVSSFLQKMNYSFKPHRKNLTVIWMTTTVVVVKHQLNHVWWRWNVLQALEHP